LSSKRREDETIAEFNQRFNMFIRSLPQELSPPKEVAMVAYLNAVEGKLIFDVRNKKPSSLFQVQNMMFDLDQAMKHNFINMLQIEDEPPNSTYEEISPHKDDTLHEISKKAKEPPDLATRIPLRLILSMIDPLYITLRIIGHTL